MKSYSPANFALLTLGLLTLAGCQRREPAGYQGYLEGEFVYLAAPLAGQLEHLSVQKGAQVTAGTPLFALEQGAELASLREAAGRLRQAQARLADLQKGQRPSEIAGIEARVAQARTSEDLAQREYARVKQLHDNRVASDDDYDRARLNQETAAKLVTETEAQLTTAQLGGRSDVVTAAEAEATAAQAALDRAGWSVAQKSVTAPRAGLVYDTLYREGEFVTAASPIVALLPPENLKVRFFVPEGDVGRIKIGDGVKVSLTGRDAPLAAKVRYVSPRPEYTPPVLYNRENRAKLVFLVEAWFESADGRELHPGQPADVRLP